MELIGANGDSSGEYRIYLNGDEMTTLIINWGNTETVVERLEPVEAFPITEDFGFMGENGHSLYVDTYGELAVIDGRYYALTLI